MIDQALFDFDGNAIREHRPLVLCITNYVAMNFTANSLLAIGASPLMSFCPEEMEELVSHCDALSVNIGCLDQQQCEAMRMAVAAAHHWGKPWVLDPVGVGASALRNDICRQLIQLHAPAVIRANAAEVERLDEVMGGKESRESIESRESKESRESGEGFSGLESTAVSQNALLTAQRLSQGWGSVVVISGPIDHIVDARYSASTPQPQVSQIAYGSPIMAQITAMGCTASAVVAAYCAVQSDAFRASSHAMMRMGLAGQQAAQQAEGPGTFVPHFIDCLAK